MFENLPAPAVEVGIVYADEHLVIVDKPANLLSVPGRGEDKQDCVIRRIQEKFPEALSVHRLDYPTSGLLIAARSKLVHRQLSKMFEQRQIHKMYTAIIAGTPATNSGEIDLPLICDWPNRPLQKVDHEQGKPSQTQYHVLEALADGRYSRVMLIPLTGRSHQLRVHLQAIGHPIVGDTFYAQSPQREAANRLLLHATRIEFTHPVTQTEMCIISPAPF